MRRFQIFRTQELAQGIRKHIAEGVTFSDGSAVVHWPENPVSMTLFQSINLPELYGPERILCIKWLDPEPKAQG